MGSPAELTLRWVDDTTGPEVVANPRMQALAEAQIVVLKGIFGFYTAKFWGDLPSFRYILSTLPSLLLEAADLKTTWESFEEATDEDLNFLRGMSEKDQIEVTLERVQNVLRVVANDLTGNEGTQESK